MKDTGFKIYDRGPLGRLQRTLFDHAGTTATRKSSIDFFILNSDRVVEVVDGNGERVQIISFSFLDRPTGIAVLG
jgi:hypothetical protein